MTTLIILTAILFLAGFGLFAYRKSGKSPAKHSAFEKAVRSELLKTHRQMLLDPHSYRNTPNDYKAIFDKRARKVTNFFAEQFYGDANNIPPEQYQSIQSFIRELRQEIGNRVKTF